MSKSLFIKPLKTIVIMSFMTHLINATSGVYCGIGLGASHLAAKKNLSVNSQNFNSVLSDSNVRGELFIGYTKAINNIWLTAEGHASLSNLETKALLDIYGVDVHQPLKLKSSHGAGAAVHIGYFVSPTHKAYIKLGAEIKKFSTEFKGKDILNDCLIDHNRSFYSVAFVPGFGIETEVDPKTIFRTEYHISLHPAKEFRVENKSPKTALKVKPRNHNVTFGIYFKM